MDDRRWISWHPKGDEFLPRWVAERDWVCIEGDERASDSPLPIYLNLAHGKDGRLLCQAMIIGKLRPWSGGPDEVTSRSLRTIPVADLIETAMASGKMPDSYGRAIRALIENLPDLHVPKRRPGPKGISDDQLRMVAEAYRAGLTARPKAPVSWIAETLNYSESTVRRHLQRARQRGFLGETQPGKAGEVGGEE